MKAIVHLGMPKTGTTTLQSWLYLNRKALAVRGIGYDRMAYRRRDQRSAHTELSFCARDRVGLLQMDRGLRIKHQIFDLGQQRSFVMKYEPVFARSLRRMAAPQVILSSEYLGAGLQSEEEAKALDDWLSQFFDDIRYVIYFRRQEDLVLSSYQQRLKSGHVGDFDSFLHKHAVHNYAQIADRWVSAVGRDKLDVRLFERDWLVDADIIADFSNAIGLDEILDRPASQNESLSLAAQELLHAVNRKIPHKSEDGKRHNPVYAKVRDHIVDMADSGPARTLTGEQIDQVRSLNQRHNEDLRAAFFPQREELFAPRPAKGSDPEAIDHKEQVARAAAELANRMAIELKYGKKLVRAPDASPQPSKPRRFDLWSRLVSRNET
ncbi:MAG: hypothetical protein AAGL89_09115 [Pseudomonadota bacterium]